MKNIDDRSHLNETDVSPNVDAPKRRGFAALSPERRSEISRAGGKAAHAAGTAHQFTSEEAKVAGIKGGKAPHVRRGRHAVSEVSK